MIFEGRLESFEKLLKKQIIRALAANKWLASLEHRVESIEKLTPKQSQWRPRRSSPAGVWVPMAAAGQPAEASGQSPLLSSPAASANVIDAHLRGIFQDELPSAEQPAEASGQSPLLSPPAASASIVDPHLRGIFQRELPKASAQASAAVNAMAEIDAIFDSAMDAMFDAACLTTTTTRRLATRGA